MLIGWIQIIISLLVILGGIYAAYLKCWHKIDNRLAITETRFDMLWKILSPKINYTHIKSPISLNENGEKLLKDAEIDKFVLKNKNKLVQKIKDKNPKTAYDVQEYAKRVVEDIYFSGDDCFDQFKDYIYKNGLDMFPIFIVMGLYLRDVALAELGFVYNQLD